MSFGYPRYFSLLYPEISNSDMLRISISISNSISTQDIHGYPWISQWISRLLAASQSRAPQRQPQLLGDGRKIHNLSIVGQHDRNVGGRQSHARTEIQITAAAMKVNRILSPAPAILICCMIQVIHTYRSNILSYTGCGPSGPLAAHAKTPVNASEG